MSPIYQTITGELQCVVIDGVLMTREWPADPHYKAPNPHRWEPCELTVVQLEAEADHHRGKSERDWRRAICPLHCLMGVRPSAFHMKPESVRLAEEIEALMGRREAALIAETADRPAPQEGSTTDLGETK